LPFIKSVSLKRKVFKLFEGQPWKHNHINNTSFHFFFKCVAHFMISFALSTHAPLSKLAIFWTPHHQSSWLLLNQLLRRLLFSFRKWQRYFIIKANKIIIVDPNISFLLRTDKIPFSIPHYTSVIIVAYPVTFLWRLDLTTKFICCWAMALQEDNKSPPFPP